VLKNENKEKNIDKKSKTNGKKILLLGTKWMK
jgi:hypothetical protein